MSKTGIVEDININSGMVGIKTNEGYTIIELIEYGEIEIGDKISWNNETGLGSEIYKNISKNTTSEVYVQNHHVSNNNLRRQLLY